jgi:dTDP-glucose 4,6-dehydratase
MAELQNILVTGGSGFIGSNFIRHVLDAEPGVRILNFDLLTYAGNLRNNASVEGNPRYRFVRGDIADSASVGGLFDRERIDAVINFAAETHVDRSIQDSGPFVRTNVLGTQVLLELSRAHRVGRFLQISTDEVYGSLGARGRFSETTPLDPTNPYSATKAAADMLVLSYARTHGLPALVTRCSNNYGPCQFPEKFIPLTITRALGEQPIPVYGQGLNRREWIHVDDHSRGVWTALGRGSVGEVYNIGGGEEVANIDLVRKVLALMGKPESLIRFVEDRPAHDLRYAMDCSRIEREWGWSVTTGLEAGLRSTVDWYVRNPDWVREVRDASYLSYYERQYGQRVPGSGA